MCDGCGCDKANSSGLEDAVRYARRKAGGWHVHADGTVHRHEHEQGHAHHYVAVTEPELESSEDRKAAA
jgi:hypothetical protein